MAKSCLLGRKRRSQKENLQLKAETEIGGRRPASLRARPLPTPPVEKSDVRPHLLSLGYKPVRSSGSDIFKYLLIKRSIY